MKELKVCMECSHETMIDECDEICQDCGAGHDEY